MGCARTVILQCADHGGDEAAALAKIEREAKGQGEDAKRRKHGEGGERQKPVGEVHQPAFIYRMIVILLDLAIYGYTLFQNGTHFSKGEMFSKPWFRSKTVWLNVVTCFAGAGRGADSALGNA
jgi:hypothetical protein